MKKNAFKNIPLALIAGLSLTACSHAKENLGLVKKSPDEFSVVKRAPLSMPPDYSLRPPNPGAPRPQETATNEQAAQTVFGSNASAPNAAAPALSHAQPNITGGEAALLQEAGASNSDPNIRAKVDAETIKIAKDKVPVAKKILGLGGDPATAPTSVVNAKAEAERLQKNQQTGKPATAGATPTVEK